MIHFRQNHCLHLLFNIRLTGDCLIWLNTLTEGPDLVEMLLKWSVRGLVCLQLPDFRQLFAITIHSQVLFGGTIKLGTESDIFQHVFSIFKAYLQDSTNMYLNMHDKHFLIGVYSCHLAGSSSTHCGYHPLFSQQCLLMQLRVCFLPLPLSMPLSISQQTCFLLICLPFSSSAPAIPHLNPQRNEPRSNPSHRWRVCLGECIVWTLI